VTPARIVEALDVVEYVRGGFVTAVEARRSNTSHSSVAKKLGPGLYIIPGNTHHGNVIAGVLVN
jgi:hypothetical protein